MTFQDNLVRIRENSNKDNISKTTSGIYYAVKELEIEVEKVVQNWPIFNKENKLIFKFADIERIVTGGK